MLFGQLFLTNDSFLEEDIHCPDTGQDLGSFQFCRVYLQPEKTDLTSGILRPN